MIEGNAEAARPQTAVADELFARRGDKLKKRFVCDQVTAHASRLRRW